MTLDIQQTVLLGVLSSSAHWLLARAEITRPFWSRATGKIAALLDCPACSGFWLGLVLSLAGLRPVHESILATPFLALFLTPIFEGALLWGLEASSMLSVQEKVDEHVAIIRSFYEGHLTRALATLDATLQANGVDQATVEKILALFHVKPSKEPDA